MTNRYTAGDFANAKFAEHPDGGTAVVDPSMGKPNRWSTGTAFLRSDSAMADEGWVPVPTKPTITESDYRSLTRYGNVDYQDGFNDALTEFGIEIIPDPEPTDEELLAGIIRNIDDWQSITSPELLAKYLNTAGVTPPNVKGN